MFFCYLCKSFENVYVPQRDTHKWRRGVAVAKCICG